MHQEVNVGAFAREIEPALLDNVARTTPNTLKVSAHSRPAAVAGAIAGVIREGHSAEIQSIAYELVPSVMWGQFARPAAYRVRLKKLAKSSFPIFWGVEV